MEVAPLPARQIWNCRVGRGLIYPKSKPRPTRVRSQWENGLSLPVLVPPRFPSTVDPFAYGNILWVWTLYPLLAFLPFLSHSPCSLPRLPGSPKKPLHPSPHLRSCFGGTQPRHRLFSLSQVRTLHGFPFCIPLSELQKCPLEKSIVIRAPV